MSQAFSDGHCNHFVHLEVAQIALGVHTVHVGEEPAQPLGSRTGSGSIAAGLRLDLAGQGEGHGLVDRLFQLEEAIDIGRAGCQTPHSYVGDRSLLVAIPMEKDFRRADNSYPRLPLAKLGSSCAMLIILLLIIPGSTRNGGTHRPLPFPCPA